MFFTGLKLGRLPGHGATARSAKGAQESCEEGSGVATDFKDTLNAGTWTRRLAALEMRARRLCTVERRAWFRGVCRPML